MKKQFAIIGLSSFTRRILEQIESTGCEILLIDKDPEAIDAYKDRVHRSYIADVLNEATIGQLIPKDIDAVIVDPGDRIEVSILVTNYLKKLGVQKIFVRAETEEHGEILDLIGADHIIYPNWEAAKRITPMLLTAQLFNYMPLGNGLVIAEVKAPVKLAGKSLIQADLRKKLKLNVIAVRHDLKGSDFIFPQAEYVITEDDILLIAGQEEDVRIMAGSDDSLEGRTVPFLRKFFT